MVQSGLLGGFFLIEPQIRQVHQASTTILAQHALQNNNCLNGILFKRILLFVASEYAAIGSIQVYSACLGLSGVIELIERTFIHGQVSLLCLLSAT
jgi:hypothetical protein